MRSYFPPSDLLHSVWQALGSSTSCQLTQFRSFSGLSDAPGCGGTILCLSIIWWWALGFCPSSGYRDSFCCVHTYKGSLWKLVGLCCQAAPQGGPHWCAHEQKRFTALRRIPLLSEGKGRVCLGSCTFWPSPSTFMRTLCPSEQKIVCVGHQQRLLSICHLEKNMVWKDTCTPMFVAALFTMAKTGKQPKYPLIEWIKKMWYIYTMEYCSAIKRTK